MPVLVVGTAREGPSGVDGLARDARRIPLRGLGGDEVARILEHRLGHRTSRALARRVHRLTEGNPPFVEEVARLRAADEAAGAVEPASAEVRVPATVRAAVGERIAPLRGEVADVVAVGAVAGREIDPALVAAVGELSEDTVARALETVAAQAVVEPIGGGRHRFMHELVREAICERLAPGRRAALHERVARRLSAHHGSGRTSELTHHLRRAVPLVDAHVAVEWSLRAARAALGTLAYEEAAAHAAEALDLEPDDRARIDLLLALGEARTALDLRFACNIRRVIEHSAQLARPPACATAAAQVLRAEIAEASPARIGDDARMLVSTVGGEAR